MSYEIKSILYASDLTEGSTTILGHAVGLAEKLGAKIYAITVIPPISIRPYNDFLTKQKLDEMTREGCRIKEKELNEHLVTFSKEHPDFKLDDVLATVKAYEGNAYKQILKYAEEINADMIIMGSRGKSPLGEIFVGSVASRVTMNAKVPVLLVPIES